MALKLFTEIARVCGRKLPPVALYQAPTIGSLAALLDEPDKLPFSPLVLLRAGTEQSPVFIIHGLDGSLVKFAPLVKHIRTSHPLYGIQARGSDGLQEPFDQVEDMARYYVDAIRTLQPHGPYYLIGYSFGGLVALDMARRLAESGEEIGLLVLLAAYPHIHHLSRPQQFRVLAQRVWHHLSEMQRTGIKGVFPYFMRRASKRVLGEGSPSDPVDRFSFEDPPSNAEIVRRKSRVALARYQPSSFHGKVKFVRTEGDYYFPTNPNAVWGKLIDEIEIDTVPGDHLGIINKDFEALAPVLSRYLKEVFGEK